MVQKLTVNQSTKNTTIYLVTNFLRGCIFIIPIWATFERQFLTYSQLALWSALGLGLTMLLELPTGALADIIGRKKSIVFGSIFLTLSSFSIALSTTSFQIIAGYLLYAIGDALISGADRALIYDSLKETNQENKYPKIIAKQNLLYQIGLIVSTLSGGYLFIFWKPLPYVIMGVFRITSIFLSLMMSEPLLDSVKFTFKAYVTQTKAGFKELFQNSYITKLSFFYMLVGGITWSYQFFFNQPHAEEIGLTEIQRSWIFALIRIINSFLIIKILQFDRIINKRRAFIFFPLLIILSFLPALFADQALSILLMWGATLASTARFVILDKYTNENFTSRNRATALSSLNMLVSFVYLVVVGFSGIIMEIYSTRLVLSILGIITTIVILPLSLNLQKTYLNLSPKESL